MSGFAIAVSKIVKIGLAGGGAATFQFVTCGVDYVFVKVATHDPIEKPGIDFAPRRPAMLSECDARQKYGFARPLNKLFDGCYR